MFKCFLVYQTIFKRFHSVFIIGEQHVIFKLSLNLDLTLIYYILYTLEKHVIYCFYVN